MHDVYPTQPSENPSENYFLSLLYMSYKSLYSLNPTLNQVILLCALSFSLHQFYWPLFIPYYFSLLLKL